MKEALICYWQSTGLITDRRLLEAFRNIPREEFVLQEYRHRAYDDVALPIIADQTISQPTTVLIMIQALELQPSDKVLEIGAGSGYNAAVMAQLCSRVISTEIVPELARFAAQNLKKAGIQNVEVVEWDGSQGYAQEAPYDRIIVTAACKAIPQPLVEQLKEQGIILAPVGEQYNQTMIKGRKIKGRLITEELGSFAFVPLQGSYA